MGVSRLTVSTLVLLTGVAFAPACSSESKGEPNGQSGSSGAGGGVTSAGASGTGQNASGNGGAGGGGTSSVGGKATGGSPATAGNGGGGASAGTSSGGGGSGGTPSGGTNSSGSGPDYAGPGVACALGMQDAAANRCSANQTCCRVRLGATHCGADVAACDPCPEAGECTAIACDEPADCPGGVCCATLGDGGGAVEFTKLTCQTSCRDDQYVICATAADCPSGFTECGISSMRIRRCFH